MAAKKYIEKVAINRQESYKEGLFWDFDVEICIYYYGKKGTNMKQKEG